MGSSKSACQIAKNHFYRSPWHVATSMDAFWADKCCSQRLKSNGTYIIVCKTAISTRTYGRRQFLYKSSAIQPNLPLKNDDGKAKCRHNAQVSKCFLANTINYHDSLISSGRKEIAGINRKAMKSYENPENIRKCHFTWVSITSLNDSYQTFWE